MGFIINVAELMLIHFLPKPRHKCPGLDQDRSETLHELGIVKITANDCDYHDR